MTDKREIKTYQIKGKRGIDDLLMTHAFSYYSGYQGDKGEHFNSLEKYQEYKPNEIYINFPIETIQSQEQILKESKRRRFLNDNYIAFLKERGDFAEEYIKFEMELINDPLIDDNKVNFKVENSKVIFIDLKDD